MPCRPPEKPSPLCPSCATEPFFAERGWSEGAGWELLRPEEEGPDPPGPHGLPGQPSHLDLLLFQNPRE